MDTYLLLDALCLIRIGGWDQSSRLSLPLKHEEAAAAASIGGSWMLSKLFAFHVIAFRCGEAAPGISARAAEGEK